MAKQYAPHIIERHFTTQTVQGEVTINLNLTIKIDQDGKIGIFQDEETKKHNFELPDLESNSTLIDFGNEV